VSSDPLDDVRWCRELNGEAHHGVTDVLTAPAGTQREDG
jgi:hypothetical protein